MPVVLFSLRVRGWWWPSLIHSFFRRWRPSPMPFAFPRIDGKPLIIRTYMNLKLKTSIHVCLYVHIYIYIYIAASNPVFFNGLGLVVAIPCPFWAGGGKHPTSL